MEIKKIEIIIETNKGTTKISFIDSKKIENILSDKDLTIGNIVLDILKK